MSLTRYGKFTDIAPDVISGDGCRVWSWAVICANVRMGHRCVIGSSVFLGIGAVLGDDVHIQHGCFLVDGIWIGHRVFIGPGVTTVNDRHPSVANALLRAKNPQDYRVEPPIIADEVMIGGGAVILPGVRLGKGCQIGAGAVVTKDVPAGETWIGNPAYPLTAHMTMGTSTLIDDLGIDPEVYFRGCFPETHP